jgi:tetratricopeptide (TPR) repeat protein
MKKEILISLILIFSFSFSCSKKEKKIEMLKKDEMGIVRTEINFPEIKIPEVIWEKSLGLAPMEMGALSENQTIQKSMEKSLSSNLSNIKNLKLVNLPSTQLLDDEDIAVDYLLKGEVIQEEEGLKVAYHLIDTQKDTSLWEDTVDEQYYGFSPAEEGISMVVAEKVGMEESTTSAIRKKVISQEILNLYNEGKSHLIQKDREETDLAIQKFKQTLRVDSTFALAWLGLSDAYLKIVHNYNDRNPIWLKLAQQGILKAIEIDTNLADGYLKLGQIYLGWGDFKQAEREFRRAIRKNANLDEAWKDLGNVFIHFGLYDPALQVFENALSLNPSQVNISLSRAMILAGYKRYNEAEKAIKRSLLIYPEKVYFHSFLALFRYYQNDFNDAYREIKQGIESEIYNTFSHAVYAMILSKQGKMDEALGELELEVKPNVGNDASLAVSVAAINALLGRNGLAIQWLKKAISWGYREYIWLVNDPNFSMLKDDERFLKILNDIKEEWERKLQMYSESQLVKD